MALQVWLPLDGNLNNNGLNSMTFTNSGSSTIVSDNNGKIGKCYKRASQNSGGYMQSSTTINLNGDISMFCWAYVVTAGSSANGLVSNHSHANNTGFGITVRQISSTDYRISCSTGNGSSRTYMTYYGTTNIRNAWHHLGLTYDNTAHQFKLWVDGVCELTQSYTNASRADVIRIFDWSTTYNTAAYQPACSLNDVRIYDHCLSAEEVKRISLGLVCHLPLNHNGGGNENLLRNSGVIVSKTSYNLADYSFNTGEAPGEGETVTIQLKGQLGTNKTYFGIYNSGGSVCPCTLYPADQKNGIYSKTFTWKTTNGSTTASNTYLRVYHMPSSVSTSTSTIDWIKLEKGSSATPWCPNKNDTTFPTITETTEFDASGFSHNGTKSGTITYSNDTPHHKVSTKLTRGASRIVLFNPSYITTGSVSMWVKIDTMGSSGWLPCSGKTTSYYFLATHGTDDFYNGNVTAAGTIKYYFDGVEATKPTNLTTGWHQVAITGISLSSWTELYINSYAGESATNFNITGNYSDFRIYNTVLSADDVKALYENRL